MASEAGTKKRKKRILTVVLSSIAAVIVLLIVAALLTVNGMLNKIGKIDNNNLETVPPGSEFFDTDVPDDFWEQSDILIIGPDVFGSGGEFTFPSGPDVTVTDSGPAASSPDSETAAASEPETTPSDVPTETASAPPEDSSSPDETTAGAPVTTKAPVVTTKPGPTYITLPDENKIPGGVNWTPVDSLPDEKLLNILIVGQDKGTSGTRTRTDSMMLLSVNKETGRIALVSFLRDMYVQIPGGYQPNRLNVPYIYGGFPLLYKTLEVNFGVHVDYGFVVDFAGFRAIIDKLDGIDVRLTRAEAEHLKIGDSEGVYHMDGAVALKFARIRHLDSDFGRTSRQRTVVKACYEKIRKLSYSDLKAMLDEILPLMSTDMSNSVLLSTLLDCYRFLGNDILTYRIPAQDAFRYAMVNGMAVILPDFARNRVYLKYYLGLE
ncbi:MAG: LCP family protein [Clostridia bacterium]|nr:LCP family protein [Clostridia bacterium]